MNIILASSLNAVRSIAHQHSMKERLVSHEEFDWEIQRAQVRVHPRAMDVTVYAILSVDTLKKIHAEGWPAISELQAKVFPNLGADSVFLTHFYAVEAVEPKNHYVMIRDFLGLTGVPLPYVDLAEASNKALAAGYESALKDSPSFSLRGYSLEVEARILLTFGIDMTRVSFVKKETLTWLMEHVGNEEAVKQFRLEYGALEVDIAPPGQRIEQAVQAVKNRPAGV